MSNIKKGEDAHYYEMTGRWPHQLLTTDEKMFKKLGRDVKIYPNAVIPKPHLTEIGDSVIIDDFTLLVAGKSLKIGSFCHIAAFSSIKGSGDFTMGDFSSFSCGVRAYTSDDDYSKGEWMTNPTVPAQFRQRKDSFISIGNHVIIGTNTVILPGAVINEGASIGAGSVIKANSILEGWTVYAGIPAKPIKKRPAARIKELERQLRETLYDRVGNYIPKNARGPDWEPL